MQYLFLTFALLFAACTALHDKRTPQPRNNSPDKLDAPYVVLISIDGYRYDYTKKYKPPNLTKFIKQGLSSEGLRSVFPSNTFPNHYSIATGMRAQNHGIVSNYFWDNSRQKIFHMKSLSANADGSWYKGEPLWILANKQGMLSASYFWIGSAANIQGQHPTYWKKYKKATPHSTRIEQVMDWLHMGAKTRPHLITLYFSDVDDAGHRFGPDSDEVKEAVLKVDRSIGKLLGDIEKLKETLKINVIILSDHGMEAIDPKHDLYLGELIRLTPEIKAVGQGAYTLLYIKDKKTRRDIFTKLSTVPQLKVYRRGDFPKHYGFNCQRCGDIVVTAKAPYYLRKMRSLLPPSLGLTPTLKGTHGYDPFKYKNMQGIFYAKGKNIRPAANIPTFDNIHIYPFIAKILGLKINHKIDGKEEVLSPYLRLGN